MTSHPPGKCCLVGIKHEGQPNGEMRQLGDVRVYFSSPPNKKAEIKGAILLLPDVFGPEFINSQLNADQFAANGYFVMMPDLVHGDAIPFEKSERAPGHTLEGWLERHTPESVDPVVEFVLSKMREILDSAQEGKSSSVSKRVGAVGYCFGARYMIRFLKKGNLAAGYCAHPSFVTAEELAAIECPLSIAAAETDDIFTTEKRHESEEILKKTGVPYQINLFSHVEHSFAVRCDMSQRRQRFAKEQAFLQAVTWFDEFVKTEES